MPSVLARKLFTVIDTSVHGLRSGARSLLGAGKNPERLVPFSKRRWASDLALSRQFLSRVQGAKWAEGVHWKGVPNIKDPYDLALVPLLLWELKPRTVIELGSYLGGSAVWMADQLDAMKIDAKVYSFDIDISRIEVKHPRVEFLRGDCMKPETLEPAGIADLPRPWLLIEDAHINTLGVLNHFHRHLRSGDYLIVEDTAYILEKYRALERFMEDHGESYRVDTRYTDLFGYNATFNFNGYLKRV